MSFKRLSLALAGALAVTLTQRLAAQKSCEGIPGCSLTNEVSVNVGGLLRLTLSPDATNLTTPDQAAFDQGFQDDPGPTATVKANGPWNLTIAAQTGQWTSANGRPDKPAADLQWKAGDAGTFVGLITTPANVYGASQPASNNAKTDFSYRTLWSYAVDTPGAYALTVVYTVTSP